MDADDSKAPKTPEKYQAVAQAWTNRGQELSPAGVLLSNTGLNPTAKYGSIEIRTLNQWSRHLHLRVIYEMLSIS